ncbi:bifunctional DNA-formamidopyrimidine glycosylase/DNA-(apurinic or apyrimidinic site) lyase [Corynebacterium renale]|uniref:Formamidopyrimidine-DNA glycosylase n=1 Tax=Corynebacterium renale TaxID=1724 RepID=A0A2A9DQ21_9CORY|nr:bifunctional DNA-formamidopyrimidine glycosylase/DNA-(apurinic or apyrimidinic site) lyase [Corynebacterium renale]PFG28471.1 DNA-(apurinic or apyrimidinic site) lyase [Corynebacterium renale]SQI26349.1 formamidopyrimidine-DNA glycosylase [Corynebacterium renale]
MPELPEVEVVRRGLDDYVSGHRVVSAEVLHPRAARHTPGGGQELARALRGSRILGTGRRGKFLWLELSGHAALQVHLGMSGQMLIKDANATPENSGTTHLRARLELDTGDQVWFVDQRTFGYWRYEPLVADQWGSGVIPACAAHIAPDPFDEHCDLAAAATRIKAKKTELKRVLLDQTVISGFGNIYADETLWRAQLHPRQRADRVSQVRLEELLDAGRDVMAHALEQGGTSFDALYVNVNGQSGYFDRSLNAYGQDGRPCRRCGTLLVREQFMGRSSHFCPHCQRRY